MGSGKYGSCCAEMDIWEANSMANAYTPHPCDITGQLRCEGRECGDNDDNERYQGVCDKDGCDINPYRMGKKKFFGRGAEYEVNTLKPITVVTQFLTTDGTDDGDLSEMRRFYVQEGKIIESPTSTILGPDNTDSITDQFCSAKKNLFGDVNDYANKGGSAAMGESLDRGHVMAISLWDDVEVNMLWLDSAFPLDKPESAPGVRRGDCPGGVESTPTYVDLTAGGETCDYLSMFPTLCNQTSVRDGIAITPCRATSTACLQNTWDSLQCPRFDEQCAGRVALAEQASLTVTSPPEGRTLTKWRFNKWRSLVQTSQSVRRQEL